MKNLPKIFLHKMHCTAWHGILYFSKNLEAPWYIQKSYFYSEKNFPSNFDPVGPATRWPFWPFGPRKEKLGVRR
jgi:hypothetical protein